mmetsp:Transcript_89626/g.256054  ORF Transcript_89626/g.256054 Transcript_89626/m.256054 type:complete len:307 (-) Transcript_89626:2565-3485(-)
MTSGSDEPPERNMFLSITGRSRARISVICSSFSSPSPWLTEAVPMLASSVDFEALPSASASASASAVAATASGAPSSPLPSPLSSAALASASSTLASALASTLASSSASSPPCGLSPAPTPFRGLSPPMSPSSFASPVSLASFTPPSRTSVTFSSAFASAAPSTASSSPLDSAVAASSSTSAAACSCAACSACIAAFCSALMMVSGEVGLLPLLIDDATLRSGLASDSASESSPLVRTTSALLSIVEVSSRPWSSPNVSDLMGETASASRSYPNPSEPVTWLSTSPDSIERLAEVGNGAATSLTSI